MKIASLLKRIAELEARIRELEARPMQHIHHHYPPVAPNTYQPFYVPAPTWPALPYEVTCGAS